MTNKEKITAIGALVAALDSFDPAKLNGDGVDVFWAALVVYYGPWAASRMAQLSVSSDESA